MEEVFANTYAEIARIIGTENTIKLHAAFRGQQITFPQRLYSSDYVMNYVKSNYDGNNIRELALKFGYTERRIRQFLNNGNSESD